MLEYIVQSSDETDLAVFEYGNKEGIELVFIHGFALDHNVWEFQFNDKKLCDSCRIISIDLRGHGESSIPVIDTSYSTNDLWADDLACIFEQCDLKNPIVIAWSYGGRIINDYIMKYGTSQIAGINYIAAATLNDLTVIGADHDILNAMCCDDINVSQKANRDYIKKLFSESTPTDLYNKLYKSVGVTNSKTKLMIRSRPLIYDDMLSSISLPVLITHGAEDSFVLKGLGIKLTSVVHDSRFSLYDGVKHVPFIEDPKRFNSELYNFVSEVIMM